jgi:GLE1-like protein
MLALASVDSKELVPVLTAHIYTVCPTAIPTLPNPAANASEEELMESLGMLKKDDGAFESFERFLHRTEVR